MREIGVVRDDGLQWMEPDGPYADIVLSTRVRLARNLRDFRFGIRGDAVERRDVRQAGSTRLGHGASVTDAASAGPTDRPAGRTGGAGSGGVG